MEQMKGEQRTFISKWFLCFFCYSVIGWCYEVFLEVVIYRWGFSNRGFLFGPYCPVYGFGALIFMACLWKLIRSKIRISLPGTNRPGRRPSVSITPLLVFLGVVVITTVIELIASYIMEWLTGGWMWNYERFAFDFQGRIAPNPSIRFGIGGMVFIYLVQPLLNRVTGAMGDSAVRRTALLAAIVMAVDLMVKIAKMLQGG